MPVRREAPRLPLRVLSIFGTRPEAIKMAPVVRCLREAPDLRSLVLVTAQHREMLDQVLVHFGIEPDFDLDIMRERQSLEDVTVWSLRGVAGVLERVRPDLVLVHGDTTTTMAGALAAFYHRLPIGHVEAGLRTRDKYAPFPEEMNRHLTGVLADLHFAPTRTARDNLLREGVDATRIWVTGNTAIDALLDTVRPDHVFADETLASLAADGRRLLAVEAHRRENWGQPMEEICAALAEVVRAHPDVLLIYSVHLNPAVREPVRRHLEGLERVVLVPPVSYPDWANLMARSHMVVTDSGGLQEEAPALGKPVVLLRETTERPEALAAGTVWQAGVRRDRIVHAITTLLTDQGVYGRMARAVNPYGDGRAAARIVSAIRYFFGLSLASPEEYEV